MSEQNMPERDPDYVCEDYGDVKAWTQIRVTVPLEQLDTLTALMSMISVEPGRWKFVISASTALKWKPGVMKICVHAFLATTSPVSCAEDSSVRTLVVPTATTRCPAAFAA